MYLLRSWIILTALWTTTATHCLSGDRMFADRAADIGRRLAYAFDTPSGLPRSSVNLGTLQSQNPGWTNGASGMCQMRRITAPTRANM